jgi:hypothetical protein
VGGAVHVLVVEGRRVVSVVLYTAFRGMAHAGQEEETALFKTIR